MQITGRDLVTVIHGMLFGGLFLMACFGALVLVLRSMGERGRVEMTHAALRWESIYLVVMVALGWASVLSGAYLVYPWYRAPLPPGRVDLGGYPQRLLLADPRTAGWHTLGMEWKEHVAWFAPILMTAVAWVLLRYRGAEHRKLRVTMAAFAVAALLAIGIATGLGALIDKQAPVAGGHVFHLARGSE